MHNFVITCDGGSLGNGLKNSFGYGSFIIENVVFETGSKQIRHRFGNDITDNEAEYMIVIEALKLIQSALEASGHRTKDNSVLIKTDSARVIGQCSQGWKIKALNIRPLVIELMDLINKFSKVEFEKVSGDTMFYILGH